MSLHQTKPTVLVAGGAGYIGSHVVRALAQDYRPVVLDNLSTGHRALVPKEVPLEIADVRNSALVEQILRKYQVQAVVHLCAASLVGESVEKPLKYFDNNVSGAISLLQAMETSGVKSLVFSSTAAVYGQPKHVPIVESDEKIPINPYGQSKLMIEQIINTCPWLKSIALRYFNVCGASNGAGEVHNPETHLIPCAIKAALIGKPVQLYGTDYNTKDGTCIRDYVHVWDLAHAHLLAVRSVLAPAYNGHNAYNLGTKTGSSVRDVLTAVQTVLPQLTIEERPKRAGDPDKLIADTTAVQKALNWQPQLSLQDAVSSAVEFHKYKEQEIKQCDIQ